MRIVGLQAVLERGVFVWLIGKAAVALDLILMSCIAVCLNLADVLGVYFGFLDYASSFLDSVTYCSLTLHLLLHLVQVLLRSLFPKIFLLVILLLIFKVAGCVDSIEVAIFGIFFRCVLFFDFAI